MLKINSLSGFGARRSGVSFDVDAQAFFTAASITDATQKSAVNQLVLDLKAASIWTKMTAVYPFVGASATPHSYNLKNPATFQITWHGTVTHNANGIAGDSSTGYGDTGLSPSSAMSVNDAHISIYCRTTGTTSSVDMGSFVGASQMLEIWCRNGDGKTYGMIWSTPNDQTATTVTDSSGLTVVTRRSSTDMEQYRNSTSLATNTNSRNGSMPNINIYILGRNANGVLSLPSLKNHAFASVGTGLTDTDVSNLYTAVQAFQTTLSRQV